jgi:DNA-binding GntR family transcriptional regulator
VSAPPRHQTKTELALHVLRERIHSGALEPGQRLRLEELTAELHMSPTPIREALRLLQADGLVTYRPHRGIVIAERSPRELADVYRVRLALEPLAVELAVPTLIREGLDELERLHVRLVSAVPAGQLTSFAALNAEWHWHIYDRCEPQYLREFVRRMWEMVSWRSAWALPGWLEQSVHDHEAIMAAIRLADPKLAADRMYTHIANSLEFHLEQDRGDADTADDLAGSGARDE